MLKFYEARMTTAVSAQSFETDVIVVQLHFLLVLSAVHTF